MNVEEDTLRRIMREEISSELGKKLDTRFSNFEKRIDSKLDSHFDDFETKLAKFFGDTHRYFDKRFDKFETKFDKKFNTLATSVAGIVKRMDADDIERAAMNSQLDRHETNVNELARHTKAAITAP